MPSQEELRDRDYVLKELTKFVQKFFPKARLTVFGSSTNGFAFAR